MLKFFLGFLLVANAGLIVYNVGYLGSGSGGGREPGRLKNQLNAERIRIERPGVALPATSPVPVPAAAANTQACVEFGNFDVPETVRFESVVEPLALGSRLSRRTVSEIERYIVYIPPTSEQEPLAQKLSQLRQLGIEDFYVINDSSDLRRGISLGMFKSADAAQQHLASLTRRGVRDARVVPRAGSGGKTAFQVRGIDSITQGALEKLKLAFPKQEPRACSLG
ncbi:MAG: SPOR domain-containing protein [Pseudomonadota bacterium]